MWDAAESSRRLRVGVCGQAWRGIAASLHCRVRQLKLVLGLHRLHDPRDVGLAFYVKAAVRHPGYNLNYENDLALLQVLGVAGRGAVVGRLLLATH